jgi:3-isopropylmalate dehydrogenase
LQQVQIVVLPGDGIGPEVTREAQRVLEAVAPQHDLAVAFEEHLIGGVSIDAHGIPLRDEVIERARKSQAVLLGAVGGPKWDALPFATRPERGLLRIRKELGLFANLRPATVFPALAESSEPVKHEFPRSLVLQPLHSMPGPRSRPRVIERVSIRVK